MPNRTSVKRRSLGHVGWVMLRTPLLPQSVLLDCTKDFPATAELGSTELGDGLRRGIDALRDRVLRMVSDPVIAEALWIASPDLCHTLAAHHRSGTVIDNKVLSAVLRYVVRMSSRPTPFGLFAGCSTGAIGDATVVNLASRSDYRRSARLDCGALLSIIRRMEAQPAVRHKLRYRVNDSLHTFGDRISMAEARYRGDTLAWHQVLIDGSAELHAVLDAARRHVGALSTEMIESLVAYDSSIGTDEARAFLDELIDAQVLVSSLRFSVTGPEPLEQVIKSLEECDCHQEARVLGGIRTSIATIGGSPMGLGVGAYATLSDEITQLVAAPGEAKNPIQVDMFKPATALTIASTVANAIVSTVELLARLPHHRYDPLAEFRSQFRQRYERRSVPLLEVLDEELGIGFPRMRSPAANDTEQANAWFAFLLERYTQTRAEDANEIVLTADDLAPYLMDPIADDVPDSLCAIVALASAEATEGAGRQARVYLKSVYGPSGAALFGRFCHGDSQVDTHVRELLDREAELVGRTIMEVAHLPGGRLGNVTARPRFRRHELRYLAGFCDDSDSTILPSDLWVSVDGDLVGLWSERLQAEVVPRITTAHNHGHPKGLPLYKFLGALQGQDWASRTSWAWGPLSSLPSLPRVRVGSVIVSLAQWLVKWEELRLADTGSLRDVFEAIQTLSTTVGLPRIVVLAEGDNQLPLDLGNALLAKHLADRCRKGGTARLLEMWPGLDDSPVSGPEGRYAHEVAIPLLRTTKASTTPAVDAGPMDVRIRQRSFPPGGDWLFLKLYAGEGFLDHVLRTVVAPVVGELGQQGSYCLWHYLRFWDPDPHIRLRFRLRGDKARRRDAHETLDRHVLAAHAQGLIRKAESGTYEREVERYGGIHGVRLAEYVFMHDSRAALDLVCAYPGDGGHDSRHHLLLPGIDWLLESLGLEVVERARVFQDRGAKDIRTKKDWSARYKTHRDLYQGLLQGRRTDRNWAAGLAILAQRSAMLRAAGDSIRFHARTGGIRCDLKHFYWSLAHLHVNRLTRKIDLGEVEGRTYDALGIYYRTVMARERSSA